MADNSIPDHVIDIDRHGGTEVLAGPIPPPKIGGNCALDENVVKALPVPDTVVVAARNYGMSLWGRTAKISTELPDGKRKDYFLKVAALGQTGRSMIEGEFESLKAIHAVTPSFTPEPFAWGRYQKEDPETYFLLAEFREIGEQPPDPVKFTARLAQLHREGFHITTCHAKLTQVTNCWDSSWEALYRDQLAHQVQMDEEKHVIWPEFQRVCRLTLEKVIPRLLGPLQSNGRTIKPCLIHGDLWDENTATDMNTGEPFVFDAGAMYAHNEYELGNWRAPRHRLSNKSYVENYKLNFPVSEPVDEWDARNLLYSLRFNIGTAILIPGCNQRQVVFDDMTKLCEMFCPEDLRSGTERGRE